MTEYMHTSAFCKSLSNSYKEFPFGDKLKIYTDMYLNSDYVQHSYLVCEMLVILFDYFTHSINLMALEWEKVRSKM